MECLKSTVSFDMFMDNYFTSFLLLTHLGVRATGVLNKYRFRKYTIIGDKQLQKEAAQIQHKIRVTLTVVGSNDSRAIYIASSEYCKPRRFARCWNKS